MDTVRVSLRVGLVVVLLAVAVTAVTAGGGISVLAQDEGSASALLQQDAIDADEVRISIDLQADGSATWQLEFWSVLDDDESTAGFESLRADIQNDSASYTGPFADRIGRTVDAASNATGREMSAGNFTVGTDRQSLAREYGVVRYSFEWNGFANTEGDQLRAGDAIEGMYLDDGTRLLISWPTEYELQSVTPEPDDRRETAVLWEGSQTEFISGEPRVVLAPSGGLSLGLGPLAGILGGLAVLAGLGGWLLRRRSTEISTEAPGTPTQTVAETNTESTEGSTEPATDTAAESTESVDEELQTETESPPATETESEAEPDPSLLSNEEQVMGLLEANGGRMKQQTIVEELDWTDAKTSKVVSGMREEGRIESFRIGRENVLTTPEEDSDDPSL